MQTETNTVSIAPTSLWRIKSYLNLWLASTVSQFGDKLYLLALPWLVIELSQSVISATITLALEIIPQLLLAPVVGIFVDRVSRKWMMILMDLLRALLMLSIPLLLVMDLLTVEYIYVVAIIISILTLLFDSSSEAYIPTILKNDQLMDGNAKMVMIATIMRIVGPISAGLFISTIGAAYTLGITGVTFLLSIVFLIFITDTYSLGAKREVAENSADSEQSESAALPAHEGQESVLVSDPIVAQQPEAQVSFEALIKDKLSSFAADVKEGILYLVQHPVLWPITVFNTLMNFSIMGVTSLFIFESKMNQGASADLTSTIFWVSGLFAFLTTLVIKPLNKRLSKGQLIRFGSIGVLVAVALVAINPSVMTMTICYTLLLMTGILVNVSMMTLRQEIVPNHLLGRVLASNRVLVQSLSPIAIVLAGIVAHYWSVQLVFILGTILIGMNVAIAWFGKMKRIE